MKTIYVNKGSLLIITDKHRIPEKIKNQFVEMTVEEYNRCIREVSEINDKKIKKFNEDNLKRCNEKIKQRREAIKNMLQTSNSEVTNEVENKVKTE